MFAHFPVPERESRTEALDDPSSMANDLSQNLRDIRRLNTTLGETAIVLSHLEHLLPNGRASLLDVATGSADIPLAALSRASPLRPLVVTGLDCSPDVLGEAERLCGPRVSLVLGDARSLPFGPESFDVVTSSLALHHFAPDDARQVLAEMWRVARRSILVVDLVRSYPAYWGTWLATRTLARNRVTRHDGPLSVLRSYTPPELQELARKADIHACQIRVHPLFRQILVAHKEIQGE